MLDYLLAFSTSFTSSLENNGLNLKFQPAFEHRTTFNKSGCKKKKLFFLSIKSWRMYPRAMGFRQKIGSRSMNTLNTYGLPLLQQETCFLVITLEVRG